MTDKIADKTDTPDPDPDQVPLIQFTAKEEGMAQLVIAIAQTEPMLEKKYDYNELPKLPSPPFRRDATFRKTVPPSERLRIADQFSEAYHRYQRSLDLYYWHNAAITLGGLRLLRNMRQRIANVLKTVDSIPKLTPENYAPIAAYGTVLVSCQATHFIRLGRDKDPLKIKCNHRAAYNVALKITQKELKGCPEHFLLECFKELCNRMATNYNECLFKWRENLPSYKKDYDERILDYAHLVVYYEAYKACAVVPNE